MAAPGWPLRQRLRVFQIRGGQLRHITNDYTIGMLAWSADLLARHLDGRPDRRADMGPAGRGPLPAVHRRPQPGCGRPRRNVLVSPPFPPRCRQPVALTTDRRACPCRLRPVRKGPAGAPSRLPGSHSLPRMRARKSAAIPGTAKCPAARPPPPSCPMRPGVLAYHRRDNVPGQIRT